jgi:tetratricopeptide (TPR) repeat protein
MAEKENPPSIQIDVRWLLLALVVSAGVACWLLDPWQVLLLVGFGFTYLIVCILCARIHKNLIWLPIGALSVMLVLFNDLLLEEVIPWGAAVGAALILGFGLWILLTTRGWIAGLEWRMVRAMLRGKYDKAEVLAQRIHDLSKAKYGTEHRLTARSFTLLANLAHERGDLEALRDYAEQAVVLQERLLPPAHQELRHSLNLLAAAHLGSGRFQEAEKLYRRLLKLLPDKPGQNRIERAIFLHNLSLSLLKLGDYLQAEELCRSAQALLQKEPYLKIWGFKGYAKSLTAELCLKQQRPNEAWRIANEAVNDIEKQIAPYQNYRVAPMLRLAEAALATDRPLEAVRLALETKTAQEDYFGREHRFLAPSWFMLGKAFAALDRVPEAEEAFRHALGLLEKHLPAHPLLAEVLDEWGWMLFRNGKIGEAEPLLRRALECRRSWLPEYHPDVATSLAHQAALLREQGKEAEAQRLATEAGQVRQRHEARQQLPTAEQVPHPGDSTRPSP